MDFKFLSLGSSSSIKFFLSWNCETVFNLECRVLYFSHLWFRYVLFEFSTRRDASEERKLEKKVRKNWFNTESARIIRFENRKNISIFPLKNNVEFPYFSVVQDKLGKLWGELFIMKLKFKTPKENFKFFRLTITFANLKYAACFTSQLCQFKKTL